MQISTFLLLLTFLPSLTFGGDAEEKSKVRWKRKTPRTRQRYVCSFVKLSNVMFIHNFLLNVRLLSSPVCEIKSGGRNFSYYKISIFKLPELLHEIIKKGWDKSKLVRFDCQDFSVTVAASDRCIRYNSSQRLSSLFSDRPECRFNKM